MGAAATRRVDFIQHFVRDTGACKKDERKKAVVSQARRAKDAWHSGEDLMQVVKVRIDCYLLEVVI